MHDTCKILPICFFELHFNEFLKKDMVRKPYLILIYSKFFFKPENVRHSEKPIFEGPHQLPTYFDDKTNKQGRPRKNFR